MSIKRYRLIKIKSKDISQRLIELKKENEVWFPLTSEQAYKNLIENIKFLK